MPSGNTWLKVRTNELSYAFREKNLYRITLYPASSLYKSSSSLMGYRPLPPEPEMLPETGTRKVWEPHKDTFKFIGLASLASIIGGIWVPIAFRIEYGEYVEGFPLNLGSIIGWGIGSAVGSSAAPIWVYFFRLCTWNSKWHYI